MIRSYFQWLKRDWAKVGFIVAIFLTVFMFVFVRQMNFVIFILFLNTPLYMFHETEEYVFPGGFGKFFNMDIFKLDTEDEPVNENFIFVINILYIWLLLPLFGILSLSNILFGLWIPYFTLFAGVSHIILAIKAKKIYNPGLVISLVLNIPFGLWSIVYLSNHGLINQPILNIHLLIGLLLNLALPVMGALLLKRHMKNI
jgi:hypothetical protein